jgi:hypothetical protein
MQVRRDYATLIGFFLLALTLLLWSMVRELRGTVLGSAALVILSSALVACGQRNQASDTASSAAPPVTRNVAKYSKAAIAAGAANAAPPAVAEPALPPGQPDVSEIMIAIAPVGQGEAVADLLVTEPNGRRLGWLASASRAVAEIPGAFYDSTAPPDQRDGDKMLPLIKKFDLITPWPGRYEVVVVGRRAGRYELKVTITTRLGAVRVSPTVTGTIAVGEEKHFSFSYTRSDTGAVALGP